MNLTQTILILSKSEIDNFIQDVPQSACIEGVVFIREDVLRELLKTKFENSEN